MSDLLNTRRTHAELMVAISDQLSRWHRGREKAIQGSTIAKQYGLNRRDVSRIVRAAVLAGKPIGSSTTQPRGYYWIDTEAERRRVVDGLFSRTAKIHMRIHRLTNMPLDQIERQTRMKFEEML